MLKEALWKEIQPAYVPMNKRIFQILRNKEHWEELFEAAGLIMVKALKGDKPQLDYLPEILFILVEKPEKKDHTPNQFAEGNPSPDPLLSPTPAKTQEPTHHLSTDNAAKTEILHERPGVGCNLLPSPVQLDRPD